MDIKLPDGAQTTLEVDARDDDLLGLIRKLIAEFDNFDVKSIPGLSSQDLQIAPHDISALLKNIHRVRVVSFTNPNQADPVAFFEPQWKALGFHRMIYTGGDSTFLVMRGDATQGMAMLFTSGDETTVVRTDGLLDIPLLGRLAGVVLRGVVATAIEAKATITKAPAAKPVKHHATHHRRRHATATTGKHVKPKPPVHATTKGH